MNETSEAELRASAITDADIKKYDPMVKGMINSQVLKYWAKDASKVSGYYRQSIGRFGMSVEDMFQLGRMFVLKQLQWFRKNGHYGRPNSAKESTLMYNYLRNKFSTFSKISTNRKHGGFVTIDEPRTRLQECLGKLRASPDMSLEEVNSLLMSELANINKDIRSFLTRGLYRKDIVGVFKEKFKSVADVVGYLNKRSESLSSATHVSYEDIRNFDIVDVNTPEAKLILMEELMNRTNVVNVNETNTNVVDVVATRRRNARSTNFRIFTVAKTKGLPTSHSLLAQTLGKSPSAFSNILHRRSNGDAAFKRRVQELLGEDLDALRVPETV